MIRNYTDFIAALLEAGFSGAVGGSDDGVFGLFRYGWGAEDESGVCFCSHGEEKPEWHSGDPDRDPWEWRMRVLDERDDISYSKVFFRKAGYITKEWYPYFLAARRGGRTFEDAYSDGIASKYAKRIYDAVAEYGNVPFDEIKRLGDFKREEKSRFEKALCDLQMGLYITMCGQRQRVSQKGEEYGWSSTVFCTTESFWGQGVFDCAAGISAAEAEKAIMERILKLNPSADGKKIKKFIYGV